MKFSVQFTMFMAAVFAFFWLFLGQVAVGFGALGYWIMRTQKEGGLQ